MSDARFCSNCGAPHRGPEVHFCPSCGHAFDAASPPVAGSAERPAPPPPTAAAPVPPPPVPPPPVSASPVTPGFPPPPAGPPPGSGFGAAPEPVPAPSGSDRRVLWGVLAGVVVLLIGLGVGAFVILGGDDGDDEGEVFLEAVDYRGADPFTDSVDDHNATTATTAPVIATTAPARRTAAAATRSVAGVWPGLYGGTRDRATCDPEQLVAFLKANPAKARAWAGTLGIEVDDIAPYVDTLTPVILQRDTRVTNHGYRDGRATSIQSVLQAGTAVMVDRFGVPRVKCNCGNPLTEPVATRRAVRYTGNEWPTFSPANVIRVTVDVEVNVFVLVDVQGGDPITRPTGTTGDEDGELTVDDLCTAYPDDPECGGGATNPDEPELGTGDVQITLRWGSQADMDLSVTDPTGAHIDFENSTSPSGGTLDVDSNANCDTATGAGVENIFWPTGSAPDGEYTVTVTYFDVCGAATGPQTYDLTFLVGGAETELTPASIERTPGQTTATYELQVDPGRPSLLDRPGRYVQTVSGTLNPGETADYRAGKGPGFQPEETTTTTEASDPSTGETTEPQPPDCSMYEEGTPMRILCEHDPTTADASDSNALPIPVPGD